MTEERDPYQTLGVPPDASDDEIRKAYHSRARRLHPDVVGERSLDEMRELNQAWSLLKDPERRAMHDAAHGRVRRAGTTDGDAASSSASAAGGPARQTFTGQPHWTGAAGPPPGRAFGTVLQSGIYAGWSLGEIVRRDRGYLAWLRDRPEGKRMRTEIDALLQAAPQPATEGGREKKKRR